MSLTAIEIQQLYIAYYNRPADTGGFRYWSGVNATVDAAAAAFGSGPEYQARYQGMANRDIVKAMYHNLFGRAGDPDGVSYWSALMDKGALKVADVALALLRGAQGSDAQVLANKAQLAQEWTVKAGTLIGELPSNDTIRNPGLMSDWLAQVTDASTLPVARANMDSAIHAAMGTDMQTSMAISGQVLATGYLQHATVFVDSNGNGVLDVNEQQTQTDSHGHYLLISSGTFDFPLPQNSELAYHVLATGGVDISTGRVNTDTLSVTAIQPQDHGYPKNASVHADITPLSSLRDALVANGMTQAVADTKLAAAFGIAASVVGADTLATVFDADAGQQAAALHAQAVNAQVDGVLSIVGRTLLQLSQPAYLTATPDHVTPPTVVLTSAAAEKAAVDSMAAAIASQQGAFSLDQAQNIQLVLNGGAALLPTGTTVKSALDALSAADKSAFNTIVAEAAGAVPQDADGGANVYNMLAHIAQARAAMAAVADVLPLRFTQDHAADLLPKFTGTALKTLAVSQTLGDIDPYSHADDAAIAASGTVTASDKFAVEQLYVTLLGRPAEPAELQNGMKQDAATLATKLVATDEYTRASANQSVVQQIDHLYLHAFGRSGDADGLLYWSGLVNNQKTDMAGVARAIAAGAAGSDAVALLTHTVAATEFSTAIAALQMEALYQGASAHVVGSAWVTSVADTTSLASAISGIPLMFQTVIVNSAPVQTGAMDAQGWLL